MTLPRVRPGVPLNFDLPTESERVDDRSRDASFRDKSQRLRVVAELELVAGDEHFFGFVGGHGTRDVVGFVVDKSKTSVVVLVKAVDDALNEDELS